MNSALACRGAALAAALACCIAGGCIPAPEPADLVLINGRIETVNRHVRSTDGLAVRDGRIALLGTNEEMQALIGPETEVLDLAGRTAYPGFIEGHGHFRGLGRALMNLDLREAKTWEEVVDRVRNAAERLPAGEWILGWGWHQDKWDRPATPSVEGYPTHQALSRAVPDHPVLLKHAAGNHAGMINAAALQLAGIDDETPDPRGGRILRDQQGRATGVLRETAYEFALEAHRRAESGMTEDQKRQRMREDVLRAQEECLAKGVTSFHDAGSESDSDFDTVDLLLEMARADELKMRLWVMLFEDNEALEARIEDYKIVGAADGRVTVRAIKRQIDGALGSHGAWLLEPYSDLPESHGLNTEPLEDLERTAELAMEHGFQLCVHAIGDRANRETLDLFQRTFENHEDGKALRWRIEHAQHLHPDDIPRFAELGVIAAMQGVHCTSDGPWVPQRLGERRSAEGAYVWRELLDSGATVINGTDTPVEDVDPIANFYASVTREMPNGERFFPQHKMSRAEALESYTSGPAYAAFEESDKGALLPGRYADIVVLSQDLLLTAEETLRQTQVDYTILNGRIVYRRQ